MVGPKESNSTADFQYRWTDQGLTGAPHCWTRSGGIARRVARRLGQPGDVPNSSRKRNLRSKLPVQNLEEEIHGRFRFGLFWPPCESLTSGWRVRPEAGLRAFPDPRSRVRGKTATHPAFESRYFVADGHRHTDKTVPHRSEGPSGSEACLDALGIRIPAQPTATSATPRTKRHGGVGWLVAFNDIGLRGDVSFSNGRSVCHPLPDRHSHLQNRHHPRTAA
jgi:hypothetical protein